MPVAGSQYTDELGNPWLKKQYETGGSVENVTDNDWIRSAFVLTYDVDKDNVDADDLKNRFYSSARAKFVDGRFGCNIGVNCQPQFTAYADPPNKGMVLSRSEASITNSGTDMGIGDYWSEMFDDPEQIIYLRFGVPQFNSLLNFFAGAYDYGASTLARTGRMPSFIYDVTKLLGRYAALRAFPMVVVPLMIFQTADYFFGRKSAKFYTMKPTMHLYWSAVNSLMNTLAINSGIYPRILNKNKDDSQKLGMPLTIDQAQLDVYSDMSPDIFTSDNYIDAFALATRAQRLANERINNAFDTLDNSTNTDFGGYLKKEMLGDGTHSNEVSNSLGEVSIGTLIERYLSLGEYFNQPTKDPTAEPNIRDAKDKDTYSPLYSDSTWDRFKKMLSAEFQQGASFAVFRVSHTGSKSESFANNTQPSALENKMNSVSSNFQEHRFVLNSATAVMGDVFNGAMKLAQDAVMGGLDGATFGLAGSLMGMLGEGYVEIPESWQSSSTTLPSAQYKIKLEAWNGSTFTRLFKIFLPFCMIAAGAWPRSTGRQSYTAPFLCMLYDQGRVQVPMGMITEFTVSRGQGNLGYTINGAPLSMEISFTVKDLSRVLHMPLVSGKLFEEPVHIDEDSAITNYLATVAGMSMYNQIYPSSRAKIRAAKLAMKIGHISSPAYWASAIHDFTTLGPGSITLVPGLIEALSRNPAAGNPLR